MAISENKMQIVIDNYFKSECDINTSIRTAFEKGFRIGVKKASSAQPEQRWIPVTDHLPDEDVPVLVTDDAGGMATVGIDSCGRYEDTGERFWYTSQNVTAWMYTVEPYRGEQ